MSAGIAVVTNTGWYGQEAKYRSLGHVMFSFAGTAQEASETGCPVALQWSPTPVGVVRLVWSG